MMFQIENKLFLTITKKFSTSQKWHFSKGVNPRFWSKTGIFFLYLFSVKKGLEIRLSDVLDRKQTFFDYKNKIFLTSQKSHFSKGVNPCFQSKNGIFFFICFQSKKGLEIMLNDVLDRKQTFLTRKTKFFDVSKIAFFRRG